MPAAARHEAPSYIASDGVSRRDSRRRALFVYYAALALRSSRFGDPVSSAAPVRSAPFIGDGSHLNFSPTGIKENIMDAERTNLIGTTIQDLAARTIDLRGYL